MTYAMMGLGVVDAEARRRNDAQGIRDFSVGPGFWDDYLDAALVPRGIPSSEASRVPGAIRAVLERNGNEVSRVVWGGGEGLESIRGKVYVKWKPLRPYNAVTYADIARRVFLAAAGGFPSGSRFQMHRYRIPGAVLAPLRGGFYDDKFVYPEGGPIPSSAPPVAHETNVEDLDPLPPEGEMRNWERKESDQISQETATVLLVGGAIALVGGVGYLYYRHGRKVRRNPRHRRRRTSR